MLRPWVPLIALILLLLLGWQVGSRALAWIGGGLLAAALLSQAGQALWTRLEAQWKGRRTRQRVAELDWKIIDNSLSDPRPKQDCERPETLGICTGRECMVYDTCQFNIKKPLP